MALVWMDDYRTRCWNCWGGLLSCFPPSAARALFLYTVAFQRRRSARQLPKKSQKEHPKRAAGTSPHGCVRTRTMQAPCKARALAWFVCVRNRAPACHAPLVHLPKCVLPLAHHLPSRWSQSVRTTRLSGHLGENFPILFFLLVGSAPRGKESLQFLFCSWQRLYKLCSIIVFAPKGRDFKFFCFITSDPKGRDFAILFYWLCPERRDFTILFYWICPEKREL